MQKIKQMDITANIYYEFNKPELKERTQSRLSEMSNIGMEEVGYGEFGLKGLMSGLYIEKVWSYSDEDFKDYMDWVKSFLN